MADINSVTLVGRLTRDAELRYTNTGTAICRLSLAINRRRKTAEGWSDEANFFDVVLWGKTGESLNQYLQKGKQVAVQGELRQSRWEQDGQSRSKVEVHALNVQLLGGGRGDGSQNRPAGNQNSYGSQESYTPPQNTAAPEPFEDDIPF